MNEEIENKKKAGMVGSNENRDGTGNPFDFQGEYRAEFTKALYFEKVANTSLEILKNIMPLQEILDNVKMLGEQTTQDTKAQLNIFVQDYLRMWQTALDAAKTIPGDLLQRAASLARKDKERLE